MKDRSFPAVAWNMPTKEMELPYASNPYFYWYFHSPVPRFSFWQDPDATGRGLVRINIPRGVSARVVANYINYGPRDAILSPNFI